MFAALSACQENGWKIGVLNQCSSPIEAWTHDGPDPAADQYTIKWKSIAPNEAKVIWSGTEDQSTGDKYLWVRLEGSTETPDPVSVDPAMVVQDFGDRHVYTVVSGEICPEA